MSQYPTVTVKSCIKTVGYHQSHVTMGLAKSPERWHVWIFFIYAILDPKIVFISSVQIQFVSKCHFTTGYCGAGLSTKKCSYTLNRPAIARCEYINSLKFRHVADNVKVSKAWFPLYIALHSTCYVKSSAVYLLWVYFDSIQVHPSNYFSVKRSIERFIGAGYFSLVLNGHFFLLENKK